MTYQFWSGFGSWATYAAMVASYVVYQRRKGGHRRVAVKPPEPLTYADRTLMYERINKQEGLAGLEPTEWVRWDWPVEPRPQDPEPETKQIGQVTVVGPIPVTEEGDSSTHYGWCHNHPSQRNRPYSVYGGAGGGSCSCHNRIYQTALQRAWRHA